jgi:hypothetical protein
MAKAGQTHSSKLNSRFFLTAYNRERLSEDVETPNSFPI